MKAINILIFASLFLLSSLVKAKEVVCVLPDGEVESEVAGGKDTIEIPGLFFTDLPVEEHQLERFEAKVTRLYRKLERRKSQYKERRNFYEYFFYAVHKKFLKKYQKEADFNDLVEAGTYNCLTATLLYAHLLNSLQVEYEILEYPYHVNILIKEGDAEFLLETTSPLLGFIDQPAEIEKSIAYHTSGGGKEVLFPSISGTCNKVSFEELTGLLFFNKAVYLFNEGNHEAAKLAVAQAQTLYPSGRLDDLKNYIASQQ